LSLVTRLLGFGLCVFGMFIAGYFQSVHLTVGKVGDVVTTYAGSTPDFNAAILAKFATYVQQSVPSDWGSYSAVGVVIAIGGSLLVALGDRKPAGAKE
jgi:hypothetical protein